MEKIDTLAQAWRVVAPADYEAHMARVGQAEANARHVAQWAAALPDLGKLIVAGAGTGQMFDFVPVDVLGEREVIFTDINAEFRRLLLDRLEKAGRAQWVVLDDNLESTQVHGPIPYVALVLVLENLDWRKALASMASWTPDRVLIVQQENPATIATSVTPGLSLPGTMNLFRERVHPQLLPLGDVQAVMASYGFEREKLESLVVLDDKRMQACWYRRAA